MAPYELAQLGGVADRAASADLSKCDRKRLEWNRYRAQVTNFELEEYLPIL